MEKIDGINLSELITEASSEVLLEKRREVASAIRQMLNKQISLAGEITKMDKELAQKNKQLIEVNGKLDKIKSGDWSVLNEKKQEQKQECAQ
jgi:phenylpyruvate tautomerase PptA (4-oxalocrotonate tautomerase family)